MQFRPCIDLHDGRVKQIVGSTLSASGPGELKVNFSSSHSPAYYAEMYRRDNLFGGHVIMLGPGNEEAAAEALAAWPNGLQLGGGINTDNAASWLDRGAAAVIVTSHVFRDGKINEERLYSLVKKVGRNRLVLDLSCRKKGDDYYIVTDRWQKFTSVVISPETLDYFSGFCAEFLVHAVDVEGQCRGIEIELARKLGEWAPISTTYAGGIKNLADLELLLEVGRGRLHATVGSALDIFGGRGMTYAEAVDFHCRHSLSL